MGLGGGEPAEDCRTGKLRRVSVRRRERIGEAVRWALDGRGRAVNESDDGELRLRERICREPKSTADTVASIRIRRRRWATINARTRVDMD